MMRRPTRLTSAALAMAASMAVARAGGGIGACQPVATACRDELMGLDMESPRSDDRSSSPIFYSSFLLFEDESREITSGKMREVCGYRVAKTAELGVLADSGEPGSGNKRQEAMERSCVVPKVS